MNKNQSVYCFNEFNYIIENGAAVITGYGGFEPKVLEIPAELDGIPVRAIGDAAFLNFEKITKVIIPENVEEIRARAFSGCWNLKEIILPSTLKTIGCCEEKTCYKSIPDIEGVFRYCGIETISIPSSVTTIGDGTFYYCRNLKEVVLPDSVQMLGKHAFDFSGLKKIKLSSNLRVIKTKTFKGTHLHSLIIPESVECIEECAFEDCEQLSTVLIPWSMQKIDMFAFGISAPSKPILYCYAGSYGLQYARKHSFLYKNAEEIMPLDIEQESVVSYGASNTTSKEEYERSAKERDITDTDYGKIISIGEDVFIFRSVSRYTDQEVNKKCCENNALVYWLNGQRYSVRFKELTGCELFIDGYKTSECGNIPKSTFFSKTQYKGISVPHNGLILRLEKGMAHSLTIQANAKTLKELYDTIAYIIAPSPFGKITHN